MSATTHPALRPGPTPAAPDIRRSRRRTTAAVLAIAGLAVAARLPFLARPLGPDEGGFLLVAAQWSPGRSLYGDYWVDRPPLLIDFFTLAHLLGATVALRVLGLGLVVAAVLLAARVGALAGGSARLGAATAAIFLVNPLLGVHEINGELIAAPLVLAGIVATLEAHHAPTSRTGSARSAWLVLAGALGAAALLVKQNELDVLVLLAVGSLTFLGRGSRPAWRVLVLAAAGAAGLTGLVLAHAASRGTGPLELWDAVVVFRLDAAGVIRSSASPATTDRLRNLLLALVASGAPFLVLRLLRRLTDRPGAGAPDLRLATLTVLAWESVSVVAGGSYWSHYLINLVPGLVLAVAVTTSRTHRGRRPGRFPPTLAFALVSCLVSIAVLLTRPDLTRADPVVGWLQQHTRPGDTAVVAFGHPDYLAAAGLSSPYSELWSLPVRVRDPALSEFTAVLAGASRPDWVVTNRTGSLQGWGIDASRAQLVFEARYRLVAQLGERRIYLDRTDERSLP